MITILPETRGNIVAIRPSGRLSHADYQAFEPKLDAVIEKAGAVRLLVDLGEFEGWELQAAWDDFALGLRHMGDFERLALVGDRDWQGFAARISDVLMGCDVRSFKAREWDDAWAWIRAA